MKKKLAIIHGNEDQIPLILKAKEMGIETHCFSWEKMPEHAVCKDYADYFHPISIFDKEKILEVCKEVKIDGVVCCMATDMPVPTIAYIAQEMGLPGNRYEDMLITRNKYLARETFQKGGVSSPRFWLAQYENMPDISQFTYPLIVKPTDRIGSLGVTKVEKEEDLINAVKNAQELSYSKQALIEEFIAGVEVSVETISNNGIHYNLTITDKETTAPPYNVEIAHHEPSELPLNIQEKVKAEARKALTALNYKYGATDTEIMITEKGDVYVIEVNPRMGGDFTYRMVELSTGYDFRKGIIDIALNQFNEPIISEQKYSGIYFLSRDTEWVRKVIDNSHKDPDIVEAKITKDELYSPQNSGERSGYFIYQSTQKRRWKNEN